MTAREIEKHIRKAIPGLREVYVRTWGKPQAKPAVYLMTVELDFCGPDRVSVERQILEALGGGAQ